MPRSIVMWEKWRCTLPGTADAYDYELKCAAGGLLIDGESYSSIVDKKEIDNGSGCKIKAECDLGNIEINLNDRSVEIKI